MGQIYLILLILHVILSVVYAADYYYNNTEMSGTIFRFAMVILIPVFGFVFMWFTDYYADRVNREKNNDIRLMLDNKTELELLKPIDAGDEVNKVPMVEALEMGDYSFRRKMVIDTLKEEDTTEYLDVLREALVNEDSETSHYASAIIMDIQGRLQDSLFKKELAYNKNHDEKTACEYEKELYKVIKSGIYDSRNLNKYYVKYKIVSDAILKNKKIDESCIHNRIDIDFCTEDTLHAQQMCDLYKRAYPESEEMVVDNIKLCIKMKDRERLDAFLEELKSMPVLLTSYSLQYVRFFEGRKA